jgi:hypothetical protein
MLDPRIVIYDLVGPPLLWYYLASNFPVGMSARGLQATAAAP